MGVLQDHRIIVSVVTGASLAAISIFTLNHFRKRYHYWNSEFKEIGNVKELFLYPIKSGKSINVEWLDCKKNGAEFNENKDRHFLVVDELADHLFLTARQYPKLVLLESEVNENVLTVKNPNYGEEVKVNLNEVFDRGDIRNATLHYGKHQEGLDCGDEVGQFLTNFLEVENKRKLRLLYFQPDLKTQRNYTTNPNFWINPVPNMDDYPAYQDLANIMLTTEASLAELNTRLNSLDEDKCRVSTRNFRPNICVDGTKPFDEDKWLDVKIGEVEFACFKPCTRCVLTGVDPDKGSFLKNMQPLRLLKSYRLVPEGPLRDVHGDHPIFGVNMIIKNEGRIHVGDKVLVRYKPSPF